MPWALGGSSRRRMPWAAFVVAGAVVVGGGALGGCTGGAEPDPSPSVSSGSPSSSASVSVTPSPSPSVTASGPEIPAAAREQTEAGAEAFVRFFFDQLNTAWTEPREGLVSALGDDDCRFCAKSESDAAQLVSRGERYESNPVKLGSLTVLILGEGDEQTLVRTELTQNEVDVLDRAGVVVRTDQKKQVTLTTGLTWQGGQWRVFDVEAS